MNKPSWFRSSAVFFLSLLILGGPLPLQANSIWRQDTPRSMFADRKAYAVGDILTIIVQENSSATKDNSTQTSKSAAVDAAIATFLYPTTGALTHKGALPALNYSSSSSFDGGGQINNSEQITARIAVRVIDVLPNGNMLIEGKRQTSFSGEMQDIVLRGMVRAEDISANNTIFSFNIADSSIKFVSKGRVTDNQRRGWFTWIWDTLSPF